LYASITSKTALISCGSFTAQPLLAVAAKAKVLKLSFWQVGHKVPSRIDDI
jgi:hypothetical protein